MIELLVCAATTGELAAFVSSGEPLPKSGEIALLAGGAVAVVVSGVGAPRTIFNLLPLLDRYRPANVLNIGIAGAYPEACLKVGDVVMARTESWADMGFELPGESGFMPITDSTFGEAYHKLPMAQDDRFRTGEGAPCALLDAATVNACTGTDRTGRLRESLYAVGMESMEGAAVAMCCQSRGIIPCEVRAISNYCANRDMRPENIQLAIENLRRHLHACRLRKGDPR